MCVEIEMLRPKSPIPKGQAGAGQMPGQIPSLPVGTRL